MPEINESAAPSQDREFVISRTFDAPRDLVWKAWTEADRLAQWFGPKGCKITTSTVDLRPGGFFHFCMQTPDGKDMWGKFVFREIVPPQRLVWIHSFSDENRGITSHPMNPNWPREILSTVTFAEQHGKTELTLRWIPWNPTPNERKTFSDGRTGITAGWTGTFEQLETYLAAQKNSAK